MRPSVRSLCLVVSAAALALPAAAQTTHVVNQVGASFVPADIVIDTGDTVQWVWSSDTHTVTEGSGPVPVGGEAFNTVIDAGNPVFSICFDETFLAANPRTDHVYDYYCIPHFGFGQVGSVTVREVYGFFMDATQEVPNPVPLSPATGFGTLKLNRATNHIEWDFSFSGLSSTATAAHFHGPAAVGVNAGVQLSLSPISPNQDSDFVSDAQETQIRSHLWYVNVHTINHAPGEIRGQIHKGSWTNLGGGTVGINGPPTLKGIGPLTGQSIMSIDLRQAPNSTLSLLWISIASSPLNALGGTVHAFPYLEQVLLPTSPTGTLAGGIVFPSFLPSGTQLWFQFLMQDLSVIHQITLSNAVRATSP